MTGIQGRAHGAPTDPPRREKSMFSAVGLLGSGAFMSALVVLGAMIRRVTRRDGLALGAAAMPAGAAQEGH